MEPPRIAAADIPTLFFAPLPPHAPPVLHGLALGLQQTGFVFDVRHLVKAMGHARLQKFLVHHRTVRQKDVGERSAVVVEPLDVEFQADSLGSNQFDVARTGFETEWLGGI